MQFEALCVQRRVFGAYATRSRQCFGRVVGDGGDDVGARQQGAQAVELRHGQDHMALAAHFFQLSVDKPAQVASKRHQSMGPLTEVVQAQ